MVQAVLGREIGHRVLFMVENLFVAPAVLPGKLVPELFARTASYSPRYSESFAKGDRASCGSSWSTLTGLCVLSFHTCRLRFLKSILAAGCQLHPEIGCKLCKARQSGRHMLKFHRF